MYHPPLEACNPMTYQGYVDADVAEFADSLFVEVGGHDGVGFVEALARYRWTGYDLEATLRCRAQQRTALQEAGDNLDLWRAACEHVREWGRSNVELTDAFLVQTRQGCTLLADDAEVDDVYVGSSVLTSKIYSALYPDQWDDLRLPGQPSASPPGSRLVAHQRRRHSAGSTAIPPAKPQGPRLNCQWDSMAT